MLFKVEFMDSGIHEKIFKEIRADDWIEIDQKAEEELERLVAANRLHPHHAFVGSITAVK